MSDLQFITLHQARQRLRAGHSAWADLQFLFVHPTQRAVKVS